MATHDFVTVDMRGLKPALLAWAHAQGLSVSAVVRSAIAGTLGVEESAPAREYASVSMPADVAVKISIRIPAGDAHLLAVRARRACLSRGAYLQELLAGTPQGDGPARGEQLRALVACNTELAALSRSIRHLTLLLAQGAVRAVQEYRPMLETLDADLRAHVGVASAVLAEIRLRMRTDRPPSGT
jgi:hypothetical protein